MRFTNARRLFYILQGIIAISIRAMSLKQRSSLLLGVFAETSSQEHQLHWIIENSKAVRAANGMSVVLDALKLANQRHDLLT